MFTRSHYEAIANVLNAFTDGMEHDVSEYAEAFASMLKADNSRFDPERFHNAVFPAGE